METANLKSLCFPRESRRGFSLIELLVVISIVAVVAAAMIPLLSPSAHDQLQAAAQSVVAELAAAQDLAIANNSRYRIRIDAVANTLSLVHSGTNSALDDLSGLGTGLLSESGDLADADSEQVVDLASLTGSGNVRFVAVEKQDRAGAGYGFDSTFAETGDIEFGPLGGLTDGKMTRLWLATGSGSNRRYISIELMPLTGLATIGKLQSEGPRGMDYGMMPIDSPVIDTASDPIVDPIIVPIEESLDDPLDDFSIPNGLLP